MTGRNAPRSKQGCTTCRRRKVKCDEKQPVCQPCTRLDLDCEWPAHVASNLRRHRPETRQLQPVRPRVDVNRAQDAAATFTWLKMEPPFFHNLSEPSVPCANALTLTATDKQYLQYFPSSNVVFYYMKKWKWSSFKYLCQEPAATHKVIMRMIVAMSASDMHHNGLDTAASPGRATAEHHAQFHYANAVKEFRELLETPGRYFTQDDLEMMFMTMFLMITYEWQFGQNVSHLQTHLQGVRSLLETHPNFLHLKDVNDLLSESASHARISLIPEQLLLWILYVDVNCRTMGLTKSLLDWVLKTQNPALHPDRLYRCARLWARCYWGKEYPDDEVTDDMENYRALHLLHEGMMLRHKLWEVLAHPQEDGSSRDAESLFAETLAVQERFSDLFITAKLASKASTRRTLNTINMAVTTMYAQILFHRRLLLSPSGPPTTTLHSQALRNIVEICQKQHDSDPRLLRRLHWPLLAAVIEIEDDEQRQWLRQRLAELRSFHAECAWAHGVAERVLQLQGSGQGQYVDLRALLRDDQVRRNHHT